MGSKYRLIPWIYEILKDIEFNSALDAFSGSGVVSYLFKSMGKTVYSNDFLHFSSQISRGLIENNQDRLSSEELDFLLNQDCASDNFISQTFKDVFYSEPELLFLDKIHPFLLQEYIN